MKNLKKILSLLLVVSMIVPGFAFAAEAEEGVITRIAGDNRYGTAIEVSKAANESADTVILATGEDYADALAGNVLAKAKNAPILLTNGKVLRADILEEIKSLGADNVIILGGENAIAASMEGKLEAEDLTVERLEGKNRFATAVAIAEEANSDAEEAFLVTGREFADALAIGSVAARDNTPILLTEKDSLPVATKEALAGMTKVTIVGGTSAVSNEVKTEIEALDIEVNRVEGDNREKTAKAIAEEYFTNPENVVVASGKSYQDAMVGGYLAAKKDAPVMLIRDIDKIEPAIEYLEASQASKGYILGGVAVVSEEVEAKVEEAILFEEVEEPETPQEKLENAEKALEEAKEQLEREEWIQSTHGGNYENVQIARKVVEAAENAVEAAKEEVIQELQKDVKEAEKVLEEAKEELEKQEWIDATHGGNYANVLSARKAVENAEKILKDTEKILDDAIVEFENIDIVVRTAEQLISAVADDEYNTIGLGANITLAETIVVNREVTIDGTNKILTASNGDSPIKVMGDDADLTLIDVTIKGSSKAAIFVGDTSKNGQEKLTLEGDVHFEDNQWGGIGVNVKSTSSYPTIRIEGTVKISDTVPKNFEGVEFYPVLWFDNEIEDEYDNFEAWAEGLEFEVEDWTSYFDAENKQVLFGPKVK